ncbi:hypothetical protein L6452_36813 [Arctium lappa]|uniref:Uncharacterized protein n=1 Tax=Arctium lappa TaxID=4217 RepID=A0ACB8Y203_ARCLA|nr:hypothetical protein L6452_36813 [Arctium lappa]
MHYKTCLVAKGFAQPKGIEYDDIFAPVVQHTSIRVLLALVAILDMELEQLDVKTTFLHGDLEETIYMKQPEGFISNNKPDWRSEKDACVYHRSSGGISIYLFLYVDDMLIACRDCSKINRLKDRLKSEFEMKDLGEARVILGMEILRDRKSRTLRLTQKGYIQKILKRFNLDGAKLPQSLTSLALGIFMSNDGALVFHIEARLGIRLGYKSYVLSITILDKGLNVRTVRGCYNDCPVDDIGKAEMAKILYASAVGSLMYAMVCTRPDLAHFVGVISRFLSNLGKSHWNVVKTVFRYLKGTETHGLIYGMQNNCDILSYCDSDYAGDRVSWKSTSGYVFTLGGTYVSWRSRLQSVVALSTTEAKLIAAVESAKEEVHLHELFSRTKHINVRDAFLVALYDAKVVYLKKILSENNIADMFTKSLPPSAFEHCLNLIQLRLC